MEFTGRLTRGLNTANSCLYILLKKHLAVLPRFQSSLVNLKERTKKEYQSYMKFCPTGKGVSNLNDIK